MSLERVPLSAARRGWPPLSRPLNSFSWRPRRPGSSRLWAMHFSYMHRALGR